MLTGCGQRKHDDSDAGTTGSALEFRIAWTCLSPSLAQRWFSNLRWCWCAMRFNTFLVTVTCSATATYVQLFLMRIRALHTPHLVLMVSLIGGHWAQGVWRWIGQVWRADRQDCGLPFCAFLFPAAADAPILISRSTIKKKSALFETDIGHLDHIEVYSVSGFEHRAFTSSWDCDTCCLDH